MARAFESKEFPLNLASLTTSATSSRLRLIVTGVTCFLCVLTLALSIQSCTATSLYEEVLPVRGDLTAKILASGRVQPDNRVDIKAPVAGRAEKILVREGDQVKRGQILLWMSSDVRAAVIDAARLSGPVELAHWEKRLPPTPVVAPVDGLVIQRNIEPGQIFGDTTAILVLSDRFVVEAPVDETDVSRIKEGQSAVTVLDAYPDFPLRSKVLRVSHEAIVTNNVTTYRLEIELEDVPEFVRVGMTANVSFELDSKKEALLIPSRALRVDEEGLYVYVGPGGGRPPKKRSIQIGLTDPSMTEVVSGLEEGDVVYIPRPKKSLNQENKKTKAFMPL